VISNLFIHMDEGKSKTAIWSQEQKARMKQILGGRCVRCGTTENLTFDCIQPKGDAHHRLGSVNRVAFYKEEMRRGNLQILCALCNSKKRDLPNPAYTPFRLALPALR
jgi:5-methylcytosine-specific restriction endonuclease McrA